MKINAVIVGALLSLIPIALFGGSAAKIHFPVHEHDFGDVIHGQSPSVELTFTNRGDEVLVIEKIESSCGCAKAVRGSTRISPGDSSKIFAQIITLGMPPGRHIKTVDVRSNDPQHPSTRLKLIFNVIRHVSIDPQFLALRVSNSDKDPVFRLKATNHWTKPIALRAAKSNVSGEVSLVPEEVVVPPGGKTDFQLSLRLNRGTGQSSMKGSAHIETSDPLERVLRLRYYIEYPKTGGT